MRALFLLPLLTLLVACGAIKDDAQDGAPKAVEMEAEDRKPEGNIAALPAGSYRRVKLEISAETKSQADKDFLTELQGFAEMEYSGPGGSPIYYEFDGKGKGAQVISQADTDPMVMKFTYTQGGENNKELILRYDGGMQTKCVILEVSPKKLLIREEMVIAGGPEGMTEVLTNSARAVWTLEPAPLPGN